MSSNSEVDLQPKTTRRIAGISVRNAAASFAKKIGTVAAVYLLGYFDFSIAWLIGPIIYSVIREEWRKEKDMKRNVAKAAAMCSEKEIILARVDDLPSWVFFPDVERAEWVNKIIRQVWPNVNHYAKTLIKNTIEPAIRDSLADYKLNRFQFQKMILGTIPPRVGGIKVYDKNVARNEILMDLDFFYAGDCDISFTVAGVTGGIKDFQIHGLIRVVMKPLISVIPMVGGLQIFFLNNPIIDFNLVGVADVLDMPGLSDILRQIIAEQVAGLMVLPNKLPIMLSDEVPANELKTPEPEGVLRVHVVEAKNLMEKDFKLLGKGSSDPFAIINVGAQEFRTKTINSTVDPKWDFWCEFIIFSPGQELHIVLKDQDDLSKKDSKLGRATVEINNVANRGEIDTWITLENVKKGQVRLRMTWLKLSDNLADLRAAKEETQHLRVTTMSSCLLLIFIDSVKNLRQARPQSKPDPYVTVSVGQTVKTTAPAWRTDSPVFEKGFVIFVKDPEVDTVTYKVIDKKTGKEIGEFVYNLSQLLTKMNLLVENEPFQLKKSGEDSKIILTMKLRILKYDGVDHEGMAKLNDDDIGYKDSPPNTPVRRQPSRSSSVKSSDDKNETFIYSQIAEDNKTAVQRTGSVISTSSQKSEKSLGRIRLTLEFSQKRQRFEVTVHEVNNLPLNDPSNIPDPYVKLYLLPERNRDSKRRTEEMKDTCNPSYEHKFEYIISQTDLSLRQLEVSVCTRKGIFSSQSLCLGQVLIDLYQLATTNKITDWYDLKAESSKDKDD